jgi:hypothetical protein
VVERDVVVVGHGAAAVAAAAWGADVVRVIDACAVYATDRISSSS